MDHQKKASKIMNKKTCFFLSLLALSMFVSSPKSKAESYVGVQSGIIFNSNVDGIRGRVNLDDYIGPGVVPNFPGTNISDVKLDESVSIGIKAGHFFKRSPFLGIEGEINYSKPDVLNQNLSFRNPALPPNLSLEQRSADVHDINAGFSLIGRITKFKHFTPYVGIGPNIHYFLVRGSGETQIPTPMGVAVLPGPDIKEDKIAIGLQAKAGVRVPVTEHFAVDFEYKFNYSPVQLGQFRNVQNLRGDFTSHQAALGLVYVFGKK